MKPIEEEKISYIARLNEVSPGTFLFYMKGNDTLTLIGFISFNLVMYFYYSYILIITYSKRNSPSFCNSNKRTIISINRALNTFFTLFWWIFYTPFIEINSGSLVTGSHSFFTNTRTDMGDISYENKSKIIMFFAIVGLLLTITTCSIIIFFFRNYEFHDTNLLKRRYNSMLIGMAFCRFFLAFFYYLNFPIVAVIKHYIA